MVICIEPGLGLDPKKTHVFVKTIRGFDPASGGFHAINGDNLHGKISEPKGRTIIHFLPQDSTPIIAVIELPESPTTYTNLVIVCEPEPTVNNTLNIEMAAQTGKKLSNHKLSITVKGGELHGVFFDNSAVVTKDHSDLLPFIPAKTIVPPGNWLDVWNDRVRQIVYNQPPFAGQPMRRDRLAESAPFFAGMFAVLALGVPISSPGSVIPSTSGVRVFPHSQATQAPTPQGGVTLEESDGFTPVKIDNQYSFTAADGKEIYLFHTADGISCALLPDQQIVTLSGWIGLLTHLTGESWATLLETEAKTLRARAASLDVLAQVARMSPDPDPIRQALEEKRAKEQNNGNP